MALTIGVVLSLAITFSSASHHTSKKNLDKEELAILCFDEKTVVWSKNETQSDEDAKQVLVGNLKEGDLVRTIGLKKSPNEPHVLMWTRATDVTVQKGGNYIAHTFLFSNDRQLTVTSPHIMIIWKDGKPYFVRADQVQPGDNMIVDDNLNRIKSIKAKEINTKVNVETEDGTIEANGILTSGFCDHNPDLINMVAKAEETIDAYKISHFGSTYNSMCMDVTAWRIAYMANNGYSA